MGDWSTDLVTVILYRDTKLEGIFYGRIVGIRGLHPMTDRLDFFWGLIIGGITVPAGRPLTATLKVCWDDMFGAAFEGKDRGLGEKSFCS